MVRPDVIIGAVALLLIVLFQFRSERDILRHDKPKRPVERTRLKARIIKGDE